MYTTSGNPDSVSIVNMTPEQACPTSPFSEPRWKEPPEGDQTSVGSVRNGTVGKKGSETSFAGLNQGVLPSDIQIGLPADRQNSRQEVSAVALLRTATSVSSPYSLHNFR